MGAILSWHLWFIVPGGGGDLQHLGLNSGHRTIKDLLEGRAFTRDINQSRCHLYVQDPARGMDVSKSLPCQNHFQIDHLEGKIQVNSTRVKEICFRKTLEVWCVPALCAVHNL